jgi:excisionase family DNA binding protein
MTDITTSQAAQQLKVTERTVRNWIEEKIIDAYKLNPQSKSVYRIPQSEIERILRLRIGSKNKNKSRA